MAGGLTVVVDYGAGNLANVVRVLTELGGQVLVSDQPEQILAADRLVLPGVGSFAAAMAALEQRQLIKPLQQFGRSGRPFLGICLGMQLLASFGEEDGQTDGLGLIPGRVTELRSQLKIPHVGWNQVSLPAEGGSLFAGVPDRSWFYFVHSYCLQPLAADVCQATSDHGVSFVAAVWRDSLFGVQFHPEKSGAAGRRLLSNFLMLGGK